MKIITKYRKEELVEQIQQSSLDAEKKKVLSFLLSIDSNFLNYSFGHGDGEEEGAVDWDFMYTELKTYFLTALMEGNWKHSFGNTTLEENLLILNLVFDNNEKIDDFVINGRLKLDKRKVFNEIEIYLSNADTKLALEKGVIEDTSEYIWLVD